MTYKARLKIVGIIRIRGARVERTAYFFKFGSNLFGKFFYKKNHKKCIKIFIKQRDGKKVLINRIKITIYLVKNLKSA